MHYSAVGYSERTMKSAAGRAGVRLAEHAARGLERHIAHLAAAASSACSEAGALERHLARVDTSQGVGPGR